MTPRSRTAVCGSSQALIAAASSTRYGMQNDPRFDCTQEAYGFGYRKEDAVPVELPAGAALVFDGYLLHRSLPNTSQYGTRRALVNHYMSAESLLPWFPPSGHEAMGFLDHRDICLVAGKAIRMERDG